MTKKGHEKVPFQCPDCGTQLVETKMFVDYGCPNDGCDASLVPKSRAEPLKIQCPVCDKGFETEHAMKTHRGQQHEQCEECGQWFKNGRSLGSHKGQAH